jgi:hypothetical protein
MLAYDKEFISKVRRDFIFNFFLLFVFLKLKIIYKEEIILYYSIGRSTTLIAR